MLKEESETEKNKNVLVLNWLFSILSFSPDPPENIVTNGVLVVIFISYSFSLLYRNALLQSWVLKVPGHCGGMQTLTKTLTA